MKQFRYFSLLFVTVLALVNIGALTSPKVVNAADHSCGTLVTAAPQKVSAVSGPGAGQVTLYWDTVPYANRYAVSYGTESNKYVYGATNIGGEPSRSYTVNYLKPGVKYYFRLSAAHDCSSGPESVEVSAYSAAGGVMMPVTSPHTGPQAGERPVVNIYAGKQLLTAASGPGTGEVTLFWPDADSANDYHLMYGTVAGKYQYGALKIGNINKYTVRSLVPGTTYYFALVPLFNGRTLYTTSPVKAVAGGGFEQVQMVETSREALIQPLPFKPPTVTPPPEVLENSRQQNAVVKQTVPTNIPPYVVTDNGANPTDVPPLNQRDVLGAQDQKVTDPGQPGYVYKSNSQPLDVRVGAPEGDASDVDWGK